MIKPVLWLALAVVFPAHRAGAAEAKAFFRMSDQEIASALKTLRAENPGLEGRIAAASGYFLGTPYRLGPLGEGEKGEFDRDPLVSFKEADCTTLVETVMALSLKPELPEALKTLQRIRYRDGRISYETRNHFPEADWIPNNIQAGFIEDITRGIAGDKTGLARKLISKRDWYARKTMDDLRGFDAEPAASKEKRLARLQGLGRNFEDRVSTVPYVPIEILPSVIEKIPSGAIANLVREDSPDKPVLISHQVLIVEKNGAKYVRHAAFGKAVEDVPALEYFYRYFNSPWRLLGLNISRLRSPGADASP